MYIGHLTLFIVFSRGEPDASLIKGLELVLIKHSYTKVSSETTGF